MISRREYTNSWPSFASLIAENCSGHAWLWGSGGITKEGGFTVSLFLFVSPFYNLILWDVMSHSHKFLFCCCEYKKNYWKSQRKNGKMWVFIPSQWNSKYTAVELKFYCSAFRIPIWKSFSSKFQCAFCDSGFSRKIDSQIVTWYYRINLSVIDKMEELWYLLSVRCGRYWSTSLKVLQYFSDRTPVLSLKYWI